MLFQDHQLTDTGANKGGKENITDDSKDSGLLECIGQSVENNDIKRQVKIQKPLNSEYMLNKKMIELMERNIKYVYLYIYLYYICIIRILKAYIFYLLIHKFY